MQCALTHHSVMVTTVSIKSHLGLLTQRRISKVQRFSSGPYMK